MSQESFSYIFPFFESSKMELLEEQENQKKSLYCNFETVLKSEALPKTWFKNKYTQKMREIGKDQDQESEIS